MSATVDGELLNQARKLGKKTTDAALFDDALQALLARHPSAEIDDAYRAHDRHPLDEPDEWDDLASFREAAASS